MLKASVLIVGDDPHLLRTQTELLCDYQVVTACSREAGEARVCCSSVTLHLRAATWGSHPLQKIRPINQNRRQRTLNRGLSRPVMQAWCSRNHIARKANRKAYTSWC